MRALCALPGVTGPVLLAALRSALAGTGPAVLPLPADHVEAARVVAALRPDEPLADEEVALVVPTSGSTGEPKGVLLTAACLRASATATLAHLGGPGTWLSALAPTHIGGLQVLLRSLLTGTDPVALAPGPFTPEVFAAAPVPAGRRYTALVPTQLRRLLGTPAQDVLASYDAVLLGGAAAPEPLLQAAVAAGVRVVTTYGMSETSGGCVYDGAPLPGVRVLLDTDQRIRLSGPVVARGYRLRPDLTAAAFEGQTYVTGDLGTWDGDRLVVLGRVDDLVVTGGEKVAPAAVEAALAGHPAVVEAAVVGVADQEWGQRVRAVVVLRAPLTLDQAREHVAARLGRFAAPRELLAVDALPLLPSGKPDCAALRSLP